MSFIVHILEDILGTVRKHNESSQQISFDCPACCEDKGVTEDNKGNLEVNYTKGIFHCWSCGGTNNMKGPIEKLLKKYGNKQQLKNYLLLKPETDYDKQKKENLDENGEEIIRENNIKLPEGFKLLKKCTSKDYKYDVVMHYLKERNITDEMIEYNNIGYTTQGKYFNRIVIPSYGENGDLNYFVTRAWDKWVKPKYFNPSEDEIPKTSIIFNEGLINWDSTIYLTEGIFDSLTIPNSIPILGKTLFPLLEQKLQERAKAFIVVCLDGDAFSNSMILYKLLNTNNLHNKIRLIKLPENHDPSSINELLGKRGIIKMLSNTRKPTNIELF